MSILSQKREEFLRMAVERMYENEGLTAALKDDSARILLDWGVQQIKQQMDKEENGADKLDDYAHQLERIMHRINYIVENHLEYSEMELVQKLIDLAEKATDEPGKRPTRRSPPVRDQRRRYGR